MPKLDIAIAQESDYGSITDFSIAPKNTDGIAHQKETEYVHDDWPQNWGYFNSVSDLKSALILKAIWNTGRGFTANADVTANLNHITGWGKDTFKDILFNQDLISSVGGDSFAEIVRNEKTGTLVNLKPLDPGTIKTVINNAGIIKRYEQIAKITSKGFLAKVAGFFRGKKRVVQRFKPNEIFHLSNNRLADQIHGISDISGLEPVILAENESFEDNRKLSHFQARPFIIFKLKTDNKTKISNFADKIKHGRSLGEDMFIPDDENLLTWDVVQVNPSSFLDNFRNDIRNKFYRAIGLPQIVPGGGGQSADSESKAILLAFEQIIKHRQLYLEGQIKEQLGIELELVHPTLISDLIQPQVQKDGAGNLGAKPSELDPAGEI